MSPVDCEVAIASTETARRDSQVEVVRTDDEDTFKEVANRISAPISFIGIDISSLDARDVPGLSLSSLVPSLVPLPTSFSAPVLNGNPAAETEQDQSPERTRAMSLLGNLRASKSMSRMQDALQWAKQSRPASRASSRMETSTRSTPRKWRSRQQQRGDSEDQPAPGHNLRTTGSTPELTRTARFAMISGPVGAADSSVFCVPDALRNVKAAYEAVGPCGPDAVKRGRTQPSPSRGAEGGEEVRDGGPGGPVGLGEDEQSQSSPEAEQQPIPQPIPQPVPQPVPPLGDARQALPEPSNEPNPHHPPPEPPLALVQPGKHPSDTSSSPPSHQPPETPIHNHLIDHHSAPSTPSPDTDAPLHRSSTTVSPFTASESVDVAPVTAPHPSAHLHRLAPTTVAAAPGKEKRLSRFSAKRLPGVLSRTWSSRSDILMAGSPPLPATPTKPIPAGSQANGTPLHMDATDQTSRSAPAEKGSLKNALKASAVGRTRSQDRAGSNEDAKSKSKKEKDTSHPKPANKANGSSFGLGKAGRGFFSKLTRSGSSHDKAGMGFDDSVEYEPRVLKLPLIEQTRETRIAKSYESCRDKTEFWMPALPWRCIDYLNGKCEEEGLYRVSGGLTNVRRWRRRFDTEHDINLLDEPDLYDASVIASLFKEWIRELPEEIFPKTLQAKVSSSLPNDVPGKQPVPQSLRDELSNLPPFNYYLLFAITCHLSLLLSHEPKNKMTLDNLYRCFNQSLKLDGRIFYTLVGDWRQCWQGCFTENEFLRKEYEYLNTPFPEYPELERRPKTAVRPAAEDVAVSSSPESTDNKVEDSDVTGKKHEGTDTPVEDVPKNSQGTPDTRPTTSHTVTALDSGKTASPLQAPHDDVPRSGSANSAKLRAVTQAH